MLTAPPALCPTLLPQVHLSADNVSASNVLDLGDVLRGEACERRLALASSSPFPVSYSLVLEEGCGGTLGAAGQQQGPAFYCRCAALRWWCVLVALWCLECRWCAVQEQLVPISHARRSHEFCSLPCHYQPRLVASHHTVMSPRLPADTHTSCHCLSGPSPARWPPAPPRLSPWSSPPPRLRPTSRPGCACWCPTRWPRHSWT